MAPASDRTQQLNVGFVDGRSWRYHPKSAFSRLTARS